jgi:polar amino acid transport system substrate-binding protein
MKRQRLLLAAAVVLPLLALLAWLLWPGQETPLAQFMRRDGTWQAMQERGSWRVGMDPSFPPFETLDASNLPAGYDVELAKALAAEWGLEIEIVAIGFDSLLDALQAGKIDAIVSAYPYDARLTRDVAFSQPYFDAGLQLAVPNGAPIRSTADLAGQRVAVEWGSEGDMIGRQLLRDGLPIELVAFETPQEAVAAAVQGTEVAAALVDGVTLRQVQANGAPLVAAGPYLTSNPYVIVLPRRATELLENVNAGLQMLRQDGVLQRLEERWFVARTE